MEGADNELTGELVTMNSPRWNIGVIPTPSQGPLPLYVCNCEKDEERMRR